MVTEKLPSAEGSPAALGAARSPEVPVIASEILFRGHREVIVTNGTEAYRLRITSKGNS
jgi:hemin uptake protein HemP